MDYVFGTAIILVIALLASLYIGWSWGPKHAIEEISGSNARFTRPIIAGVSLATIWVWFIRIICPGIILGMLLNMFGVKLF